MRGFELGEDVDAELGPWLDRIHPDDRARVERITSHKIEGHTPTNNFEYRERHRDGSWVWIMSRGQPIAWAPDGTVIRVVGTDSDITQLKLVEQRLMDEKERLHVTMQSIADGMISTGPDGRITFMNATAEALTSWPLQEAMGLLADEVFNIGGADSRDVRLVQSCLDQREVIGLDEDTVITTRTGTRLEVRLTASPVLSGEKLALGVVIVFQDATDSRTLKRRLAYSASHDSLTRMPNRSAFEEELVATAEAAQQEGREHALCFVDLDGFKVVNDSVGHAAGDQVLFEVGQLISQSCRATDFAARIGGDEFALILKHCTLDDAKAVCEKLVLAIAQHAFTFADKRFAVGASVGITAINGSSSLSELSMSADAACYDAKAQGRGCVVLHQ
jgi:diguanylate cyclase (GGDEF)-like protein/PAS domain S-box-containing protein